jgi:vacuolar-type H+-ATPase subunit E/Vma4
MEIVRTSEALELQILDDARAKAVRILDAADKECAAARAEWNKKDEEEVRRLQAVRAARVAAMQQDLDASLPLDFLRSRLRFFQDSVANALKIVFASLDASELGRLIGGQVARAAFAFINQHVVVSRSGISEQEARRIVAASIPGAVIDEVTTMSAETAEETGKGLVVATSDGSRRFRATMQEISALLLEEHREELLKALFGKEVQK